MLDSKLKYKVSLEGELTKAGGAKEPFNYADTMEADTIIILKTLVKAVLVTLMSKRKAESFTGKISVTKIVETIVADKKAFNGTLDVTSTITIDI